MKTTITTAGKLPVISETASVKEIKKLHGGIIRAAKMSLESAIRIGELLEKIRTKIPHGQWQSWAEKHLPFDVRTARNYCRCFEERDRLKTETVSDLTAAYKFLAEPKTEPAPLPPDAARLSRAKELDAQLIQSLADIKTAAADFGDGELPPGFIGFNGMKELFKTRGKSLDIELTNADEAGFRVIEWYLANSGAVVSREKVLECLRQFNPAREMELAA
jgi:hypothetical protein